MSLATLRRSTYLRCALCALALAFTQSASAWWAKEWTQRKPLAVDTGTTGANLAAAVNDAPLLLRLHAGNFPQFLNVREGGLDLRFVAGDDQTPLKYHVEKFDAAAQMALVWVKLPVVNPQTPDNRLFMYFGNAQAVDAADPGASFDADTALALHFAGPTLLADSTAYQTQVSGTAVPNPASLIGQGALLDGSNVLTVADAPQLRFTADKGFTIAMWTRFDSLPSGAARLVERSGAGQRLAVSVNGAELSVEYAGQRVVSTTPLVAATWQHIAVSAGGGELRLFVDGRLAGSAAVTLADLDGPITLGGVGDGSARVAVALDEVEVSTVARSAEYLALASTVQGTQNDRVITYAADESADSAAGGEGEAHAVGHFTIIFQSVFGNKDALVEQLVIGVCGVMMIIAALVMVLKGISLGRARKATAQFLTAYEALAPTVDDPNQGFTSLYDRARAFKDSPLFRVYRRGLDEVRSRFSPAVGAAPVGLDDKAMMSLRAVLDAVMVREGQKLNSQLVLLTIAISGGPFIGLLGTVVGVMVTFAAIAATGDVNIAAIAPGMAAALLATVAGLGVAIPSLFGYNYLGARVKDISADMHVFADEFMARVNEYYGR
ncbi:MAG: DUF2341 domain-containing protein [Gammaproteobacteria bacterium]|nr:DUF2341 domain-containing protein [Gammaproteobacteria bacterium]